MRRWVVVAIAAAASQASTPAMSAPPATDGHVWRTYGNVRFAFQLCYPVDMLRPQPESDNGDGRTFLGANGAKLLAWGNNAMNSVAETARISAHRLGTVSYRVVRPDWFVLSAKQGDTVVYLKARRSGDRFESFELHYPATAAAAWSPVVARIGTCLRALDGPSYSPPSG